MRDQGCAMHFLIAGILWMMFWAGLAFLFVTLVRS